MQILLLLLASALIAFGVVQIVFGAGLMKYTKWGQMGTMVLGALNLLNVPFGTAFGIAALYYLTRPEAQDLFQ